MTLLMRPLLVSYQKASHKGTGETYLQATAKNTAFMRYTMQVPLRLIMQMLQHPTFFHTLYWEIVRVFLAFLESPPLNRNSDLRTLLIISIFSQVRNSFWQANKHLQPDLPNQYYTLPQHPKGLENSVSFSKVVENKEKHHLSYMRNNRVSAILLWPHTHVLAVIYPSLIFHGD